MRQLAVESLRRASGAIRRRSQSLGSVVAGLAGARWRPTVDVLRPVVSPHEDLVRVLANDTARLAEIVWAQQLLMSAEPTESTVLAVLAEQALQLTGGDAAVVERSCGDQVVYAATAGTATGHEGLRLDSRDSLCGPLDGPIRSDDTLVDPRVTRIPCDRLGSRSLLAAPLRHGGACLGTLTVHSHRTHGFTDDALDVLCVLSEFGGSALARAALYDENTRLHAALEHTASHDGLTGLANRSRLNQRLESAMGRLAPGSPGVALVFVDLDDFKPINDRHGHAVGDAVLVEVARRLTDAVLGSDTVCRLGGDEFVVLSLNVANDLEAAAIRRRVVAAIEQPLVFPETGPLHVGTSSGVVTCFDLDACGEELLARADAAM